MTHAATTNDASSYTPHTILITGGAGFIGSNVLLYLHSKYPHYKLICLDSLNPCASIRNLESVSSHPNIVLVHGDICNSVLVVRLLREHQVDTILHFAAQTHVDNSFGDSVAFTEANVLGTHVLLESIRAVKSQIKRFIHVSTDEVYGEANDTSERFSVERAPAPTNPYAATKTSAEYLVKSYHTSFDVPIIITRSNNVFGPRQYPEKLIPKLINLLKRDQPCPIHGNGHNKRSYLYVTDVAEAFNIIMHRGTVGEVYNIGSDVELENLQVLQKVIQLARKKQLLSHSDDSYYIEYVRDRAFNDLRYHIDWRGLQALGWKRQWDFDAALEETMDWYLQLPADYWPNMETALQAHPQFATQPSESPTSAGINGSSHLSAVDSHVAPAKSPTLHHHVNDLPLPTTRLSRAFSGGSPNPWSVDSTYPREHRITSGADGAATSCRWLIYNSDTWLGRHFVKSLTQLRPLDAIIDSPAASYQSNDDVARLKQQITDSRASHVVYFLPDQRPTDSFTQLLHHRSFLPIAVGRVCRELHVPAMLVTTNTLPANKHSSTAVDVADIDAHTAEMLTLLQDATLHICLAHCVVGSDDIKRILSVSPNYSTAVFISVLSDALPAAINLFTNNDVGAIHLHNPEPVTILRLQQLYDQAAMSPSVLPSQKPVTNGVSHQPNNTSKQQWSTHGTILPPTETSIRELLQHQ